MQWRVLRSDSSFWSHSIAGFFAMMLLWLSISMYYAELVNNHSISNTSWKPAPKFAIGNWATNVNKIIFILAQCCELSSMNRSNITRSLIHNHQHQIIIIFHSELSVSFHSSSNHKLNNVSIPNYANKLFWYVELFVIRARFFFLNTILQTDRYEFEWLIVYSFLSAIQRNKTSDKLHSHSI